MQEAWTGRVAPGTEATVWDCLAPEPADALCKLGARRGPGAPRDGDVQREE